MRMCNPNWLFDRRERRDFHPAAANTDRAVLDAAGTDRHRTISIVCYIVLSQGVPARGAWGMCVVAMCNPIWLFRQACAATLHQRCQQNHHTTIMFSTPRATCTVYYPLAETVCLGIFQGCGGAWVLPYSCYLLHEHTR